LQNVVLETDQNSVTQVVYTLEPKTYGNLISQIRSGTVYYGLFDALGSTDRLTDSSATVTDAYVYSASGIIQASTGTTTMVFKFAGQEGYYYDLDLSRYYLRARYYDPITMRFLSKDPIKSLGRPAQVAVSVIGSLAQSTMQIEGLDKGSTVKGGNLYTYALNNPVNRIDPSGLFCRIRVHISRRFGFGHYGLSITDSRGQYELDAAPDQGVCSPSVPAACGCSNLYFYHTPGYNEDLTNLVWDEPDSTCLCLWNYAASWNNGAAITYDPTCANSNWGMKCMLDHCGLAIAWGWFSTPIGWNCQKCAGWVSQRNPRTGTSYCLCTKWVPKECP
jgi:RHS repeat-associated protein